MRLMLILILAAVMSLLTGCATRLAPLGRGDLTPQEQQNPLMPGETIYLLSAAIDGNSAGFPSATIDSAGDANFLGVEIHVAGLTPAEATTAIQRAFQPKYFRSWDFVVTRVQPTASPNGGPAKRPGNSGARGGPPSVS